MEPYNEIKNLIITGKYEPGKRLTEEELANTLNISRTPIRQAIHQLQFEGLVTQLKKGVIVREFTKKDIEQIYNLRAVLEGYATREAALNRTTEDLTIMQDANHEYKTAVKNYITTNSDDLSHIFKSNKKFHDRLLLASKNDYLKFHIDKVVVLPLVFRSFYWYNEDELYRSYTIHHSIIEAIKNHDFERANTAICEHIYQARDHVLKHAEEIKSVILKGEGK